MKVRVWVLLAAVLLAFRPAPSPAQEVSSAGFGEVMTVTEVQVPVHVFADGEPVAGLSEKDFEIYDNGELRELSAFEVVDLTVEESAPTVAAVTPSDDAHRSLLVVFDLAFNSPRKLSRAVDGIERMLAEQLHPRDKVAIATFDLRRGITLMTGLTGDRAESQLALSKLRRILGGKRIEAGPFGAVLGRPQTAGNGAGSDGSMTTLSEQLGATAALALAGRQPGFSAPAGTLAREGEASVFSIEDGDNQPTAAEFADTFARDATQRSAISITRATTEAFAEIVTLLRAVPGQKQFLYLSRGLPEILGDPEVGSPEHPAIAPLMAEMFRAFKASGWKLQAVDISGVPDPFGGGLPGDGGPTTVGFASGPLVNTAKGTGGDVYENFNDIALATRQVIEKTRITYLLTFAIANPPDDGKFHRLEVRLKGPAKRGVRLVHRDGYYNQRPLTERTTLERRLDLAQEVLGDTVGGDFEAHTLVVPFAPRQGVGRVAVWLEVLGPAILKEKREGKLPVRLEAYLIDRDQRFADSTVGELAFDLNTVEPRLRSGGLRVYLSLTAPPGEHRLRLRLVEEGTGRSWLGTAAVSVPEASGATRLLSPIFPELFPTGVVARLDDKGENPFRFGGRELVPRASPSCRPGERLPVLLLIEGTAPNAGLSAQLLSESGKPVAGGQVTWLAREERDEADGEHIFGTVDCSGLSPGQYWLNVSLLGREGGPLNAPARSGFEVLRP